MYLHFFILYLISVVIFFIGDIFWVEFVIKHFSQKSLRSILNSELDKVSIIIYYLIFVVGILAFAVYPSFNKGSLQSASIYGAAFGFFTYFTYDWINYMTVKIWPLKLVIIDIMWGTIMSGIVAYLAFSLSAYII